MFIMVWFTCTVSIRKFRRCGVSGERQVLHTSKPIMKDHINPWFAYRVYMFWCLVVCHRSGLAVVINEYEANGYR